MNELIQITTGGQGSPVVSARELYIFLGLDESQWSRWSKKNIINNPYSTEGEDWQVLDMMSKNTEKGRPSVDYALTLDFAKRLSMLARTEKGEEARRYFLECEKRLQSPIPTTEQVLIQLVAQQNQLMAGTQELLSQLRADVDRIMSEDRSATAPRQIRRGSRQLGLPGMNAPHPSLRQRINRKIDDYCDYQGYNRRETWNYLYRRLFEVYAINVHRLKQNEGENMLDTLERYGHLDSLHKLVVNELNTSDDL
ncbi:antA/AntB antirepressor family protein [Spirosoma sp.]|uniref:antA/AntB antirepressor family protein n=1 Tax=Spirosoma sp. TaxID=1899569 RepID=UPI00261B6150|nr:antA/AntB antirepressor family protein [Spirosoma sp.]MCX6218343.1 antA/AntB antirepressor family protein [Spirosoma sp.]